MSIEHGGPPLAHPRYKNRTISSHLSDKVTVIRNKSTKGDDT